ncbi:hypothetical protein EYF80_040531 [Liparis tanakae]|uniref:Uncharacterized protein n=1 Tax=Liparis tanakae TaxID=230148 RepID=A0A4Z2G8D8_9TELE|nr:hypothetical protein EYF80_040531 [Liparis tanakae]
MSYRYEHDVSWGTRDPVGSVEARPPRRALRGGGGGGGGRLCTEESSAARRLHGGVITQHIFICRPIAFLPLEQ